ncbi:hypothetical protein HAX54_022600 [Datura stramonium]|uniref:Leucine-rich repeat-containing N-terminal plant-type domain-containing protein n=1 Tax=Datura stramonium TaxID=4076 RepID=A0ABS8S7B8_DATST|nr:hypothetical protein [Datura stramonium]
MSGVKTKYSINTWKLTESRTSGNRIKFQHSLNVTGDINTGACESSYPKTASWNRSSMDCCRWDGVACDGFTGHVIGFGLECGRLEGTIHPNSSLFQLGHLQTLDLSSMIFLVPIFRRVGQLVSLAHLNLSYSSLQGRIPLEISRLSKLISLDLSDDRNLLSDQFGFQDALSRVTKVRGYSLSQVNISSSMPMNVSSSSSLRYLDLGDTNLRGDLPESIFLLPNLETLRLSGNNLTVSFPKFNWSSSYSLRELDLSDSNITGGLPSSFGSLKALKLVRLSECNLVGPIPESIRNLSQITQLDLSNNHFRKQNS